MSGNASDRRLAPRVEMDVPARVRVGLGFRQAHCRNASLMGLGLEVFTALPRGTPMVVSVQLEDRAIELRGELVREGQYPEGLAGVRIVESDHKKLARLFAWVRRHAKTKAEHHGYFADEWATAPD
jgi:hypothetical protein